MKHTMLLFLVACILGISSDAQASGCPNIINYQGRVTDAGGDPVADGDYEFVFRFFTVPTGGTDLWSEVDTLTVNDGLFNHLLGSVNPLPDALFPDNDVLYLEVTVEGETLPRTLMVAVGYARRVNTVNGSDGGVLHIDGGGPDDHVSVAQGDPNASIELRSGTFGGDPYIDFADDAVSDYDARLQLDADGRFRIKADSLIFMETGKVGIGNVAGAPQVTLHVRPQNGATDEIARFQSAFTSASPYVSIWYGTFEAARFQAVNDVSDGGSLRLFVKEPAGMTERMRIASDGKVGMGTSSPQGALDVSSTTGAFIVPRMTTAQRNALSAVNGMIIYNTTDNQFNFYEAGAWVTK